MAKRLNARCQDLLEIITEKESPNSSNARVICSPGSNETFAAPKDFQLYRVDFLHRTVRDFLNAAEMREIFSSRLPPTFDSARWLCASFVQQLKLTLVKKRSSDSDLLFVTLFDNAMHFARESEIREHNPRSQTDLLDELEHVGAIFYKNIGPKFLKIFLDFQNPDAVSGWAKTFEEIYLEICVKKDLLIYVLERLDEDPESEDREQINSLLPCALFPRTMQKPAESSFEVPNPRMVKLILDKGGSPNWSYGQNTTTWLCFINFLARSWANTGMSSRKVLLAVIRQLLDYGAAISSERGPKAAWVEFLIMDGSNWEYRGDSEEFQAMLCDLIDITAARVNVNICHKGCTVWGHFVNNLPEKMARRTKLRILRTIQTFLRNGADPYFDYTAALVEYDPKSKQRGEHPIGSKLLQIFTESELISCGMPLDSIQVLESVEADRFRSSTAPQKEVKTENWWTNVPKLWRWGGA